MARQVSLMKPRLLPCSATTGDGASFANRRCWQLGDAGNSVYPGGATVLQRDAGLKVSDGETAAVKFELRDIPKRRTGHSTTNLLCAIPRNATVLAVRRIDTAV